MLKIVPVKNAKYYSELTKKDDYYHKGREPLGEWYGAGAEEFGLTGEVGRRDFLELCYGYDPKTRMPVVKNAGKEGERGRRFGWDLTFSADKTVSEIWGTADEKTRELISELHDQAVKKALLYAQEHYGRTRTGDTGRETEETKKLFFALFEHASSRALDPQLHTHAVMVNLGITSDGKTRSLESYELKCAERMLGALYRAELAHLLQKELGVEVEQGEKGTFKVKHVSEELCEHHSKRRAAIEEEMERLGLKGGKAAATVALNTRDKKEYPDREELFERWKKEAEEHSFDYREALNRKVHEQGGVGILYETADKIQKELTEQRSTFSREDFIRRMAEEGSLLGVSAKDVIEVSTYFLESSAIYVQKNSRKQDVFTTKEIIDIEKKMIEQVKDGASVQYSRPGAEALGKMTVDLSDEQWRAVEYVTDGKGQFKVICGMAGTGKTTTQRAVRELLEAEGYTVRGVTIAAKAAKILEKEAGIESSSIAKLIHDTDPHRFKELYKELAKQGGDEREEHGRGGKWGTPKDGNRRGFDSKTVLVVDEAAMVDTRIMAYLVDLCRESGARLILTGDEKQLQPIGNGGAFKLIGDLFGKAELKEIRRQREEWAREAVYDIAEGRAEKALFRYLEAGLLEMRITKEEVNQLLINTWKHDRTPLETKGILANTNADVRTLNDLAQQARREQGELGSEFLVVNDYHIHTGDRVVLKQNNKRLGVLNGDSGEVIGVNGETRSIIVQLEGEASLKRIPLEKYQKIELNYCQTSYSSQGKTLDNMYVVVGQDREHSYVEMSRHRNVARLYASVEEVGPSIEHLAKSMNRSNIKESALYQLEQDRAREKESQEKEKEREREKAAKAEAKAAKEAAKEAVQKQRSEILAAEAEFAKAKISRTSEEEELIWRRGLDPATLADLHALEHELERQATRAEFMAHLEAQRRQEDDYRQQEEQRSREQQHHQYQYEYRP